MPELKWTTDKPTVAGFYWIRYEERRTVRDEWYEHLGVVEVVDVDGTFWAFFPGSEENCDLVGRLPAEWYGPLAVPN